MDFLATSLIVVAIPGTGVVCTVSVALNRGRHNRLIAAFGCTLGIVPHLLAACFWPFSNAEPEERTAGSVILRGVLLNLLNPKLTIFFLAILPQFLPAETSIASHRIASLLGLGAVFTAMTLGVFAVYAVMAAMMRDSFATSSTIRRRVEQSMGVVLAAFAAKLAFTYQ